jgi:hypothetical protein
LIGKIVVLIPSKTVGPIVGLWISKKSSPIVVLPEKKVGLSQGQDYKIAPLSSYTLLSFIFRFKYAPG